MSKTILLVDDDPEFRAELKEALYEYAVVEASYGQQALSILKKPNEIDLVLLDVNLPGGPSGTDILREIKKISSGLKIIILTGYSSKDIAIEALKGRADDYLEKPIDIVHTKEIIDKLLGSRPGQHAGETLHLRDKIEKVKRFIERNFDKKAGLAEAAHAACLSPKYLSRVFKEVTGSGFSEYKLRLRIRRARQLLKRTNLSIAQISDKLGYQNTESFIRMFEQIVHTTPTHYRKR
jgi:two-component system, response regulator YesN